MELPGLKVLHKRQVLRALDLYGNHGFLDFEDALSVATMERQDIGEIYSYDEDFDRLQGTTITRREP